MSSQVDEGLEAATAGGEGSGGLGGAGGAPRRPPHPAASPLTRVHLAASQLDLPLGLHHVEGQRQHRGHLRGERAGAELPDPTATAQPQPILRPPGGGCRPQDPFLTVPEMAPEAKLIMKVASSSRAWAQSHSRTSS